jgi:hypothetical protein
VRGARGNSRSYRDKKIYAPLVDIVGKSKDAIAAQRKLREHLSERMKHKPAPLIAHPVKSMIKSGSVLTLIAPPYDYPFEWVDPHMTGAAHSSANFLTGDFGGDAASDSYQAPTGYGQAAAGFGIVFRPMFDCFLQILYQISYQASWYEDSNADTAHTNGSSELLVQRYDLDWNFQATQALVVAPIWSDGTSWYETHIGSIPVSESVGIPGGIYNIYESIFSANANYIIWFIGIWEADGAGAADEFFNSTAQCSLQGNLPYVVLKQN